MKCLIVFGLIVALFGAFVGYGYVVFTDLTKPLPKPEFKDDTYWGPGDAKDFVPDEKIYEFKLQVPQSEIDDLRKELNRTLRLTEPLDGIAFEYGFNTYALEQFVDYWRDNYLTKWDERQELFNSFKQYKTEIQGWVRVLLYNMDAMLKNVIPPQLEYSLYSRKGIRGG